MCAALRSFYMPVAKNLLDVVSQEKERPATAGTPLKRIYSPAKRGSVGM